MKKLLVVILSLGLSFCCLDFIEAGKFGGSRGGSSFRSSGSRSSFKSTPSRSYTKPSRSASPSRPSKPSTATSTSGKRATNATKSTVKRSPTQQKAYEKAKLNGKAFASKDAAVKDFKSKAKSDPKTQAALSKSYPTSYASEPSTRPSHIPASYNNQTVVFNNGGYGYRGSDGAWNALTTYMLMDTMSDAMMMNAMRSQGYYYDTPVQRTVVHHNSGSVIWVWLLVGGGLLLLVVIIGLGTQL